MFDGLSAAQKQICQMRSRGSCRSCKDVIYLVDNVYIGYEGPVVWGVAVCVRVGMSF